MCYQVKPDKKKQRKAPFKLVESTGGTISKPQICYIMYVIM